MRKLLALFTLVLFALASFAFSDYSYQGPPGNPFTARANQIASFDRADLYMRFDTNLFAPDGRHQG